MIEFNKVWEYTQHISSETAFSKLEGEALFEALMQLGGGSRIVEVGCEFGRSTSIIAQVVKEYGHELILIDPFIASVEQRPMMNCARMLEEVHIPFSLYCMTTEQAVQKLPLRLHFVHIDGDHSRAGVKVDCRILLPRIGSGGWACFHDYGRPSLEDVKEIVDWYTKSDVVWDKVGVFETLMVVRRKFNLQTEPEENSGV